MATLHATYKEEFLKGKYFAYDGENTLFESDTDSQPIEMKVTPLSKSP